MSYGNFFRRMEEFGYSHDLEEYLPEDFSAVFDIGRILEDPNAPLSQAIAPALAIASAQDMAPTQTLSREWKPSRNTVVGEEYDTEMMRSVSDIKRILPRQHLLPDEIFLRRLAQRTLWITLPRSPITRSYKSSSSEYSPNNFKQKVYLLLDTSTSMASHHRFQTAKGVAYYFLQQNLKDLGNVYLRTFDVDVGPLQTAVDQTGLRRLIRYTMRLSRLGNGTAMERAILQAAADIRAQATLSGAEILMITDGACHLNMDLIGEALGDSIRLNCIKIGDAVIYPDEDFLRRNASAGSLPRQKDLARGEEQLRRLRSDLVNAQNRERDRIRAEIAGMEGRLNQLRNDIVGKLKKTWGREIEILSNVFVHVEDQTLDEIFELGEDELGELKGLLAELEQKIGDPDAETLRQAALLYEHVEMLLKSTHDPKRLDELKAMGARLTEMLQGLMETSAETPSMLGNLSRNDLHDISMILHTRASGPSLLALALRMIRKLLRIR